MAKVQSIAARVLTAVGLLLGSQYARAATYYVATTGSNSNPGTLASPFQTLQAGVNAAHAGDTVIVRDGTYGPTGGAGSMGVTINTGGSPSAWITLQAEHKGMAVLDCQLVCQAYINLPSASAAYWKILGFDITGGSSFGIVAYPAGANNLLIQGNTIHNIGNHYDSTAQGIAGVFTDANVNVTVDGNVIHDVGRTAVLTGSHDHGIYTHGVNMVISNNVFYNILNGWHIQTAVGFSGTIANNTFFGPNPYPGKVGQVVIWDPEGSISIRNNVFYNPNSVAVTNVGVSFSGPCSFDHNIVYSKTSSGLAMIDSLPSGCVQSNNLLNVDPKLTTPSLPGYDFHLLTGSPAIGAGVVLAAVPADFGGVSRGSRNDLGAFTFAGGTTVSPPVISAVSATGVGQTAATIGWTTDKAADSQAAYGLTSAYGSATALNAAQTTSHSAAVSGLTAGTVYHYAAKSRDSAGNLAASPDATFTTTVNAPPPGCVTSAGSAWQNVPLAAQTGAFIASFDATPAAANIDGTSGLANGPASAFTSMAAAVRFNNTGMIDARNGGAYAAASAIPYVAGMTYHFNLAVNVLAHTYTAYVAQGSNAQQLIGSGYAFRTEQASVSTLNDFATVADIGGFTACNPAVTAAGATTVISAVSAGGIGQTAATIVWTTNNPADSQVQYGPTSAYGATTPLAATPATSHSVSLGGLTPGTAYHFQVMSRDATGALATSPDATFTTAAGAPPPSCVTSSNSSWQNVPLTAENGSFTAEFDAVPATNMDGVSGLSNGPAAAFTSYAAAVRFNNTGKIDARNGGVYAASAAIPYVGAMSYHFRLVVNVPAHTYSAYVKQGSNAELLIGAGFAFRTEQKSASLLNNFAATADIGSFTACNATAHP